MAEDKTYSELSKLVEKIKETTEGIEKEAEQMTDAFSSISTVGEVSSDALNDVTARMREYQSSIMSNAKIMKLSTAQQDKFLQESSNATKSLSVLQDQLNAGEEISTNSFAAMQDAMQIVASGVSSFTGELSKSEREIEKRKKEEGAAGAGMLQRKLIESQEEYLEKLEASFASGGIISKGFSTLGNKITNIVPGIAPLIETLQNSLVLAAVKNAVLPYWIQYKEYRKRKKLERKQKAFWESGGDPENRMWDLRDGILGVMGKLPGPIGDFSKAIREVREKGLGITNWHKLGETPYASEQAIALRDFVQNQRNAKDAEIQRSEMESRDADLRMGEITKKLAEIEKTGREDYNFQRQELNSNLESIREEQTLRQTDRENLESEKLSTENTNALANAVKAGIEEKVLASNTDINALIRTQKEQTDSQEELLSGSPPYLKTVAELAMERTDLAKQQLDATEKSQEPSPAEKKIGSAFGEMKGKMSGMMSGAVGFLKGIGTAVKGIPGRIGKTITGLGKGIATMFKALGSIDPRALVMGLAAITGLSLNMLLLAGAVRFVAPALVKIFGGLSNVLGAFAGAVQKIGGVIIGIGRTVIDFMTTFVRSIVDLANVPFMAFVKLGAGFGILALGLTAFAVPAAAAMAQLNALGIAAIGLAELAKVMPNNMGQFSDDLLTMGTAVNQAAVVSGAGTTRFVDLNNTNNALTREQQATQGNVTIVNSAVDQSSFRNNVEVTQTPYDDFFSVTAR